jgi:hypothetical protein
MRFVIARELRRMHPKHLLTLVLAIVAAQYASAEGIRISPKWIEENPGKLSLLSGSGFGGHTDYIAYLKTDREAIYEVWTKLQFVTDDKGTSPWITTKTSAGAPAKSIRFGDTSYGIHIPTASSGDFKAHVIYEVYEISVKTDANGEEVWSRNLAYTLDRSDWTALEAAVAEQQR